MIWKKIKLVRFVRQIGDELGNMTGGQPDDVLVSWCRETPWTDQQIAIEGREVTKNEQRFIMPYRSGELPKFDIFVVDGVEYEPTEMMRLNQRYIVIQGKVYKHGLQP